MLWMLWKCSHKQPHILSKEEKDKVVKIWWKSEQFLMVTQGKARRGNQRWLWGHLACLSTSCTTFKTPPKHKDAKIWKVLSKCKSGTVHQVLFLCTNSCFPSISRNLKLAASHSSLGEMTSLIERPTTSCSTSTTSTWYSSTSATSTKIMVDINRDQRRHQRRHLRRHNRIVTGKLTLHIAHKVLVGWEQQRPDRNWLLLVAAFLKLLFKLFSSFSSALL